LEVTVSPPTGRVLALLELLQTVPGATAMELAGRLRVDERTVRRDAAHLCELGIPVRARRGRYGGFRLVPGTQDHRMAPLILTEPEAVAVMLSLTATAQAGLSTGAQADAASASALGKLRRVLPEDLIHGVNALLETMGLDPDPKRPPTAVLITLSAALARGQQVHIGYRGGEYQVEPLQVLLSRGNWRLVGYDPVQEQTLDFELDQIESVGCQGDQRDRNPD
jgi:predicted DNA-binding transcriptional regulator YafY